MSHIIPLSCETRIAFSFYKKVSNTQTLFTLFQILSNCLIGNLKLGPLQGSTFLICHGCPQCGKLKNIPLEIQPNTRRGFGL